MLVYTIAIAVALLIPLLTRGSYKRLLGVEWHWGVLLFLGLASQIVLEFYTLPQERWHDVGFGLLVASYVLILGFACRNFVLRGMGIVIIGIACNFVAIVLNQGMPVKIPVEWRTESWAQPTVKHHPQQPDDRVRFLSDIIVLKEPFDTVLSFGDLILAVGLCDVAFHASRRLKSRRVVSIDLVEEDAASDPPTPTELVEVALPAPPAPPPAPPTPPAPTAPSRPKMPVALAQLEWYE